MCLFVCLLALAYAARAALLLLLLFLLLLSFFHSKIKKDEISKRPLIPLLNELS